MTMSETRYENDLHYDPRIGLIVPQMRATPPWRLRRLLAVGLALLSTATFAVSLTLHALGPEPTSARDDFADLLVLNGPPRILLPAHTEPAPLAKSTRTVALAPVAKPTLEIAPAAMRKVRAKRQAHFVALARAELYLPPLHHGAPDTWAPMDDWSEHGEFQSKAACERFRNSAIDDTAADLDQQPGSDRALYEARIRLLMAGRCEG